MKRILIPVAVAVTVAMCMSSCQGGSQADVKTINTNKSYYVDNASHSITPVTFDGHQYLIYDGVESGSMCHSESCPCKL